MFEYSLTVLALLSVLIIPGPTNALLASSAQHVGISRSLRLIPAELAGYMYAMGLWWLLLNFTRDIWPALNDLLHLFSVIYVFWLAFRLWKLKQLHAHSQKFKQIKPLQLFYSTFKNPKALLFSVGIFPEATWQTIEHYAISMFMFAMILIPTALLWLFYGARLLNGQLKGVDQALLYRSSALFLIICMIPIIFRFFHHL